jgi:hypothetical protein
VVLLDVATIRIGDDVRVGPGVQFLTPTHPVEAEPRPAKWEAAKPITVGDNVWLGGGVVVGPGSASGRTRWSVRARWWSGICLARAADSTGGFTIVLCALKALLEHGLVLTVVRDAHPKGSNPEARPGSSAGGRAHRAPAPAPTATGPSSLVAARRGLRLAGHPNLATALRHTGRATRLRDGPCACRLAESTAGRGRTTAGATALWVDVDVTGHARQEATTATSSRKGDCHVGEVRP